MLAAYLEMSVKQYEIAVSEADLGEVLPPQPVDAAQSQQKPVENQQHHAHNIINGKNESVLPVDQSVQPNESMPEMDKRQAADTLLYFLNHMTLNTLFYSLFRSMAPNSDFLERVITSNASFNASKTRDAPSSPAVATQPAPVTSGKSIQLALP